MNMNLIIEIWFVIINEYIIYQWKCLIELILEIENNEDKLKIAC